MYVSLVLLFSVSGGVTVSNEMLFSKTFAGVSHSRVNCLQSGMSVK